MFDFTRVYMSLINNEYFLRKIIFVFLLIIKEKLKVLKIQDFKNAKIYIFIFKFLIRDIKNLNIEVDVSNNICLIFKIISIDNNQLHLKNVNADTSSEINMIRDLIIFAHFTIKPAIFQYLG